MEVQEVNNWELQSKEKAKLNEFNLEPLLEEGKEISIIKYEIENLFHTEIKYLNTISLMCYLQERYGIKFKEMKTYRVL